MESIANNEYATKDLGESTALVCSSAKLLRLQKEKSFFWFIFANKSFCEQISTNYWSGGLKLDAKHYSEMMRSLKDRLFAQR